MNAHLDLLNEILDRRMLDISVSKRNVLLGKTDEQKKNLFKACVMLIYSSLEGGIKEMTKVLLDHVNGESLFHYQLQPCYLELSVYREFNLRNAIIDQDKSIALISKISSTLMNKIKIPSDIDTESNMNPKVVQKICKSLNINYFLDIDKENNLNILLRFRNNIAHGDSEMPIDFKRINKFSDLAIFILTEYAQCIIEGINEKKWAATSPNRS